MTPYVKERKNLDFFLFYPLNRHMLTELDNEIIGLIQGDIPITQRPYLELAQKLGISENTLLERLKDLCDKGVIRRFGATIYHQKSGFQANAMVAWKVEIARNISIKTKINTYSLLFSRKELKKTSMKYFPTDDDD
jgi:DNA-binding Lrp family transcriptional regulator